MSVLDGALHRRLLGALRHDDLRIRNWSGPGDWCFAVYADEGDQYVGCVKLGSDDVLRVDAGKYGICKRERVILDALCLRFNGGSGGSV